MKRRMDDEYETREHEDESNAKEMLDIDIRRGTLG